jgi:hypothetical protein
VPATVLYMSISLDGFVAGPNEGPDNGLDFLPLQAHLLCTANEQAAKSQLCRCVLLNQPPDIYRSQES